MRNVVRVSVVFATVAAVVVVGYSLVVIGIDVFGPKNAMSGMGLAVGAVGLMVASVIGVGVASGLRYLSN